MVLLHLMESQKQMGHDPVLLSLGDSDIGQKEIEVEAKQRELEAHVLRFHNGLNLKGTSEILRSARSLNAEIIHSHGYKGNILLGIVPSSLRKIPIISTLHGWTSTRLLSRMRLYDILDAITIKKFDAVVAVSSSIVEHRMIKTLGIHPVVINNGIPRLDFHKKDFAIEFPQIAAKCKERFKILCIGRLSPEKGMDVLIKGVSYIVNRGLDASLVIIGEGPEKPRLAHLINNMNLSDKVFLLGYCDKAFCFLRFFDVFVLPSYTEGLPITLLEAMQSGTPVVATRVGEVPEVLNGGRFGRMVPPGNPEALAKGIEELNSDKEETNRRSVGARERVLTEYGLEKMVERYAELYQVVIRRKVRGNWKREAIGKHPHESDSP